MTWGLVWRLGLKELKVLVSYLDQIRIIFEFILITVELSSNSELLYSIELSWASNVHEQFLYKFFICYAFNQVESTIFWVFVNICWNRFEISNKARNYWNFYEPGFVLKLKVRSNSRSSTSLAVIRLCL